MKLKSLLPAIVLIAAGFEGYASIPLHFRDACNTNPDGGGHMNFPIDESTRTFNDETGAIKYWGDPIFNEDGSIDLQPIPEIKSGDGLYFRTKKLGTYLDEAIPSEYVVLAYDYKSNAATSDQVVFLHEHNNQVCIMNGNCLEATDTYKTIYQVLDRIMPLDNNLEWGNHDGWKNDYFWIGWNDPATRNPDFRLTVKNIRLLSLAEAAEEVMAGVGDGPVKDAFTIVGNGLTRDVDPDMENAYVYVVNPEGVNPLFSTSMNLKPLPAANTTFRFEYKLAGEAFAPTFMAIQGGNIAAQHPGANFEPAEDPYAADWTVYEVDLSEFFTDLNFAQVFASNDYLFMHIPTMPADDVLWLRNAEWINPNGATEPEKPEVVGIPLLFRDACNTAADGGGHMIFPIDESTRTYNEETGAIKYWGDPIFNADGSIDLQPTPDITSSDGLYFRTKKLGTYLEEPIPSEYVIFAYDYKTNLDASDQVVFLHEHNNSITSFNGKVLSATDEYRTMYQVLNRTMTMDNNLEWGNHDGWKNDYFWVSWNDPSVKTPDWRLTVKNLRLLTLDQAAADCANMDRGESLPDGITPANSDLIRDTDPDMEDAYVFSRAAGSPNPIGYTGSQVLPLGKYKYFTFDYKLAGESFRPRVWALTGGALRNDFPSIYENNELFESSEDPYEAEWKTYQVDVTPFIEGLNWAQSFGSNDSMWFQLQDMKEDNLLWIKNVRWMDKKVEVGVETIEAEAINGPVEFYNLQGVRVENPANGLYIRRQGNKISKVLVK